ncbi:MAG: hypothetical protein JJT81_15310 [Rubellimicrobium sp.]|nr:hypothetical protein [Rubellimicrobium sp.]
MTTPDQPRATADETDLAEIRAMLASVRPDQLERLLSDIRGSLPAITHPRKRSGLDA